MAAAAEAIPPAAELKAMLGPAADEAGLNVICRVDDYDALLQEKLAKVRGLFAALFVAIPALSPVALVHGQVVRGYVPPDELVSFPSTTPMNQFFRLINPTFQRVTGKRVVDPPRPAR